MGTAKYKTSADGYFRLWVQQTGISGNNAVLTAWIDVKGRYNASSAVTNLVAPKITANSTYSGSNYYAAASASEWVEAYRKTGILVPYASGATGGSVQVGASGTLSYEDDDGIDQFKKYESVTANFTLDTRSVASTMTFTAGTLGTSQTFTISAAASSYTHAISYSCGSASGTITAATSSRSISWTIPKELGAQAPAAWSVPITYTLQTISGGSVIATTSYDATLTVPDYSYTLGNLTLARGTKYANVTAYVANKTDVKATYAAPPSADYGASGTYKLTITQGSATVASFTLSAAGSQTATASGTGTTTATLTFTDSRGKTVSKTASVTYVANTQPTVSITAFRTGTSGGTTEDATGAYYRATASGTYNNISGNTATLTINSQTAAGSSGSASKTITGALAATSTLLISAELVDYLGNKATATFTIPQGFSVIQLGTGADHKGVSIGKTGQIASAGKLEVGYDAEVDGSINGICTRRVYFPAAPAQSYNSGWVRLFKFTKYSAGDIYISGSYYYRPTPTVKISFSTMHRTAELKKTSAAAYGEESSDYTKIRICFVENDGYYIDVYRESTTNPTYSALLAAIVCTDYVAVYNNSQAAEQTGTVIATANLYGASDISGGGGGGSGTITGVSVNGTSVATSGVANITSIPASIVSGNVGYSSQASFLMGQKNANETLYDGQYGLIAKWNSIGDILQLKATNTNTSTASGTYKTKADLAGSADSATQANNATDAKRLKGNGRITSADIEHYYDDVHMQLDIASSSMKTNKPMGDGYIQTYLWDGAGAWDTQLFIPSQGGNSSYSSDRPQIRYKNNGTWTAWKKILTEDDLTPSGQTITAMSLTAAAISASNSGAICALTNRSYTVNGAMAYINIQCVLSSGVNLAGNDWWRLVRGFTAPKGSSSSASDMGVSLNAVIYKSDKSYAGQVDAHIAYHPGETNRPAGWYLRVHTNVALTTGMIIIASGSYLV